MPFVWSLVTLKMLMQDCLRAGFEGVIWMTVFSPGRSGRVLDAALVYFASAWLDGLEDSEIEGTCSAIDATDGCSSKCLPSSIYLDSCKLQPIYIYIEFIMNISYLNKSLSCCPKCWAMANMDVKVSIYTCVCVYIYIWLYMSFAFAVGWSCFWFFRCSCHFRETPT